MYLDPGLGSIVIQALIGLAFAIPVLVGVYWKKLRNIFRRKGEDS